MDFGLFGFFNVYLFGNKGAWKCQQALYITRCSLCQGVSFGLNIPAFVENKGQSIFFITSYWNEGTDVRAQEVRNISQRLTGILAMGHSSEASGSHTQLKRKQAVVLARLVYTSFQLVSTHSSLEQFAAHYWFLEGAYQSSGNLQRQM